jgi:hypothetical protein
MEKHNKQEKRKHKCAYSGLVDDINDNNESTIVFSIVDKSNSSNLNESLERLQNSKNDSEIKNEEIGRKKG